MEAPTQKPEHLLVKVLMYFARWMVAFSERHSAKTGLRLPYADAQRHVEESQIRAGGPAWRLAEAIWWHRYRMIFPNNVPTYEIITREQNAFAALLEHQNTAKSKRYRVWQATEDFISLRRRTFPKPAILPVTDEPPPGTVEDPVRRALYTLDKAASTMQHAYLSTCLAQLAIAWPLEEELLVATSKAAISLAKGDDSPLNHANRLLARKPWNRNSPFDEALHTLNIARKGRRRAA